MYQLIVGEEKNNTKRTHTITDYRFKWMANLNSFLTKLFWSGYYDGDEHNLFTEVRKKPKSVLAASMSDSDVKEFTEGLKNRRVLY